MRIFSGVRHGSMANFSCSVSVSPKPPSRVTFLHEADGGDNRGRTFLRNQASAFGESSEQRSRGYARPYRQSRWVKLMQSVARQIATVCVGLRRGLGRQPPALNLGRINLRIARSDRGLTCRAASVSGGSTRALNNRSGTALPIRSPPHQSWGRDCHGREPTQRRQASAQSRQNSSRRSPRSHTP